MNTLYVCVAKGYLEHLSSPLAEASSPVVCSLAGRRVVSVRKQKGKKVASPLAQPLKRQSGRYPESVESVYNA